MLTLGWLVLCVTALAASGCGGDDPTGTTRDHPAPSKVRFARDIEPIFMSGCSGEYCHGNFVNTPARAYRFFVDQPSTQCDGRTLIVPGHPEASYLMEKVRGENVCMGEPMPRGVGNSLRPDQIQLLSEWIRDGARFD
jgi:hypothetical protein